MLAHMLSYLKSSRFGDLLVPVWTWVIITLPLWLSPFHPAVAAYAIIAFDLYFFYKSFKSAYFATIAFRLIQRTSKIDFPKLLSENKTAKKLQHFVIIPNYKEPVYKLKETIAAIAEGDYPYKKGLYLVLACEAREEDIEDKLAEIRKEFSPIFADILLTKHILLPNEVAGKASNQTFAAKVVEKYCEKKEFLPENVVITIADADSRFANNYFSYLSHIYLNDADRLYHFFWAPVLFYNNFWQLPFFIRMQATLSSILRLAFLMDKNLIHISTYSTSLTLLQNIGFWDVDIIPEDWHVYFQAFFKYGDKVKTIPLYTITNGDAVYSGSMLKTFLNRYDQEKRWAWGVTDVGYSWSKLFTTPHIPMSVKLRKLFVPGETHLLWASSFFILQISASIPPLINPIFGRTVLGFLLPRLAGFILTVASTIMVVYIILDIKIRSSLKVGEKLQYLPIIIVQWYLLPIVSFFLSALPALEAHTRILLKKNITYQVTEKV